MVEDEEDSVYDPDDNYDMTDTEASDYESDEDAELERRTNKPIPSWAHDQALKETLEFQYGLDYPHDPDELFGEVSTCNLVEVFDVQDPHKKMTLRHRGSSGDCHQHRKSPVQGV